MILTRSPLRITLGGGGTDLPSYYEAHGGFVIAAAIDRYVYVSVMRRFSPGFLIKYSHLETVATATEIQHPIIREALVLSKTTETRLEITTAADLPSGTGLGSSSSFTTALVRALFVHNKKFLLPGGLAEAACEIEIHRLREPIGKQDQYIAAYGGLTCFEFNQDGSVDATPLETSSKTIQDLEDNLLLFFTGFSRKASSILDEQDKATKSHQGSMLANLHYVKELGLRSRTALEKGDCRAFGSLMHEHWLHKKKRSSAMSNPDIDEWYELGLKNGAIGGKLVGAGGGGFLLFYAEHRDRLRAAMHAKGLEEVRFGFDFEGTKVLLT